MQLAGGRFGRPLVSYLLIRQADTFECRLRTTRPSPADRFVRFLTACKAHEAPAHSDMPGRPKTARYGLLQLPGVRPSPRSCGRLREALRAAACHMLTTTPRNAVQLPRVTDGCCFLLFLSSEKADLSATGGQPPSSVTGFCAQRRPSPVLLPPVVQSKLGGMLGSDHANLPPTPSIAGASKQE